MAKWGNSCFKWKKKRTSARALFRPSAADNNFSPSVRAREKKRHESEGEERARRGEGKGAVKETTPELKCVLNGEKGAPFPQKKERENNTHTSPSLSSSLISPPEQKNAQKPAEATILAISFPFLSLESVVTSSSR
jgi:hypothetical protein